MSSLIHAHPVPPASTNAIGVPALATRPQRVIAARPVLIFTRSKKVVETPGVPTTSDLERMLRGAALRVTRPRVAVLAAVHDHPHADTDAIIDAVRAASSATCRTRRSTTCCAR